MPKTLNFTPEILATIARAEGVYPFLAQKTKDTQKLAFILDDWSRMVDMELYRQRVFAEMGHTTAGAYNPRMGKFQEKTSEVLIRTADHQTCIVYYTNI